MKTILVPTDYSDVASNALHYAVELAKSSNSKIILLHAYQIPVPTGEVPIMIITPQELEDENTKRINNLKKKITDKTKGKIVIESLVRAGFTVEEITNVIKEKDVDLVVMGITGEKVDEKNDTMQYRLYGSDIIGTDKYLVKSNKNTLDRIENQLGLADFTKNRKYISWQLPSSSFDINSILPDFKEPLDNWWGDISAGFKKMKELASSAMFDIMDVYIKLKEITEEVDPIKALGIVEKLSIDYRDGSGRLNIPLPEDLYDGDFETVCYQHIKIVNKLRVDGLLDDFFALNGFIKVSCSDFLANNIPINEDIVHSMKIHFSKDKLQIININHALNSAEKYWSVPLTLDNYGFLNVPESDGIKFISSEEFEYFWLPGRIRIEERYKENLKEYYQNDEYRIICYECMQWIFNEKYHINE